MKIILDMMGSDNGVKATTEGAVMAVREFGEELILVGNETEIRNKYMPKSVLLENTTGIRYNKFLGSIS